MGRIQAVHNNYLGLKDGTALLRLLINYYFKGSGTTHRYYIQELRRSCSLLRCKLQVFMAEGPSKAPSDVTSPSGEDEEEEKEVTLDFDEDTLTGEPRAAFSSIGGFVIMFPAFQTTNTLLDFFSLAIFSFFLKFFRVTFICVMAHRNEKNSQGTRFVIL